MSETHRNSLSTAQSWETYWQGALDSADYRGGGVTHPAVAAFWDEQLAAVKDSNEAPKILDIGSGDGAVIERIKQSFLDPLPPVFCLDISEPAITRAKALYPGVHGIVADALSIPLAGARFDLVTSQFGIEYAGLPAVDEAARAVSSGGRLALLLHIEGGAMHAECAAGLDAIQRLRACDLISRSITMFEAGFAAARGANPEPYRRAVGALRPCFRSLEAIMDEHGRHVAGDTVIRLYSDIDRIHESLECYEPTEVLGWLATMDRELAAFSGRLQSMCEAAINDDSFRAVCDSLVAKGFTLKRSERLTVSEPQLPLAWALVATKR